MKERPPSKGTSVCLPENMAEKKVGEWERRVVLVVRNMVPPTFRETKVSVG